MKKLSIFALFFVASSAMANQPPAPSEIAEYYVFPNCGWGAQQNPGPLSQTCEYAQYMSVKQIFDALSIDIDKLQKLAPKNALGE